MPFLSKDELVALADAEAKLQKLDPALVKAIIEQESGWNIYASRFEPSFYKRYVSKQYPSYNTESVARSTSFGLLQLMGEVARELSFSDIQLSDLFDPRINLKYGCLHLASKLKAAKGDVTKALLLWNGGSDAAYPQQVLARKKKYEAQ